jgi:hypothetical protein
MARPPSSFEQALRLGWLNGLSALTGSPAHGIRDWLVNGTYAFQNAPSATAFEFFAPNVIEPVQAYAHDANRMSCGAFESIISIAPVAHMRRSLAWLALKAYYAAFYSAHAFLRLQGNSLTQLDARETTRIASVAQAYGFATARTISTGFHKIHFDPGTKLLRASHSGARGGTSHEILWSEYSAALHNLIRNVQSSSLLSSDRTAVTSKLQAVLKLLSQSRSTNGNWLSKIRNEINYRHSLGVWYPHPATNNIEHYMALIRTELRCDPMDSELDQDVGLEAFMKLCLFVVNLTRVTIVDMSNLHANRASFQEAGPMVVLRNARLT